MRLFCEVTRVEQYLVKKIFSPAEEAYIVYIQNRNTNPTNDTVVDVLTHPKENYGQLMPHKILEREDIVNKTSYHLRETFALLFYTIKELLDFSDITGTSYTQHKDINTTYVIIHRTVNFSLAIHKWNHILTIQSI